MKQLLVLHLAMQELFYFFHAIFEHNFELFFLELKNLVLPSPIEAVAFDFLNLGGGTAGLDSAGSNGRVLVEPRHIVVDCYSPDIFVFTFEVSQFLDLVVFELSEGSVHLIEVALMFVADVGSGVGGLGQVGGVLLKEGLLVGLGRGAICVPTLYFDGFVDVSCPFLDH